MPDYKLTASLKALELALLRKKVDPDFLSAKMETTEVRDSLGALDPADGAAVEALAARVLGSIPARFIRQRAPRAEGRPMTTEDREKIIAAVRARYAPALDVEKSRKQLEALGVLQRKGA